jgi:hypothetical protein
MVSLPLLFPKERVSASPPSPISGRDLLFRALAMTVAVLTLMVLIVAFGAEVGWLMVDPPAS